MTLKICQTFGEKAPYLLVDDIELKTKKFISMKLFCGFDRIFPAFSAPVFACIFVYVFLMAKLT